MIRLLWIFSFIIIFQNEVPFKPKEDFEIKFDLSFKQRFTEDTPSGTIVINETVGEQEKRTTTGPLPYLVLNVKILKILPDEIRVKVFKDEDLSVLNKKTTEGMEFKLDVGFTADIKGVTTYKQVIEFLSAGKVPVSKIVIEIDKEGNYFVNGEKRGKI